MAAYLVASLITGLTFATVSLWGFDAGFWTAALWYVAGCWTGFGLSLGLALLSGGLRDDPPLTQWPEQPATR